VLVDYENVQPKDIALLKDGPFKVKIFLGPNQAKIPVELVNAIQPLGINADYVLLEAPGPNALDFHIAYYIGVLSNQEAEAFFLCHLERHRLRSADRASQGKGRAFLPLHVHCRFTF